MQDKKDRPASAAKREGSLPTGPRLGQHHGIPSGNCARETRYDVNVVGDSFSVRMHMPPSCAIRLPWQDGDLGNDHILLAVLVDGTATITIGDESASLGTGDWIVLDQRQASTWHPTADATLFGLLLPRRRLGRLRVPQMLASRGIGERIGGTPTREGIAAIVTSFLCTLNAQLSETASEVASLVADAAISLLAAVLADGRRRIQAPPENLAILRLQASQFVSANSADPELNVEGVARALNCSTRYLYRAFAGDSPSPEKLILNSRLERSCQALIDPRNVRRSVGAIAFENGFTSDAHFARAFKAAYGIPPGRFRATACSLISPSTYTSGETGVDVMPGASLRPKTPR